jgi:hypothetical protein
VLVHVGCHKTGTRWLQNLVFEPMRGFQQPWTQSDLTRILVSPHDLEFDAEDARRRLAEARTHDALPGVVDVASLERLSGNPHSGGYDSRAIADRVHASFPDAQVLMVIREQSGMIASSYKQYVRVGGSLPLSAYLGGDHRGARVPQFRLSHFAYDRLIAHYQALFGSDRVLVLAYEHLAVDPTGFLAAIAEFAHADVRGEVRTDTVHRSQSGAAVALKRRLNLFLVRDSVNPAAPVRSDRVRLGVLSLTNSLDRRLPQRLRDASERRLRTQVAAAIDGRFEESNRRTAALTGLDLASLGYRVTAAVDPGSMGT